MSDAHSAAFAARDEYRLPLELPSRIEIGWKRTWALLARTSLSSVAPTSFSNFRQFGHWKSS